MTSTSAQRWYRWTVVILVACIVVGAGAGAAQALSSVGGEVLMVDPLAGKLTIAIAQGQTAVTFLVNKATKIDAGDSKDLKSVSKGDAVTVEYEGKSNQYVAKTIIVLPR